MCLQGAPLYLFMNKKTFIKKQEFENNTIYSLNEKRIDYFIDDCISLDNEEYFVVQKTYSSDHKACVFINNKENIVLDFKGGTLFCNGALSPFIIRDSSNIEIKNVSICFDRAFHTQMTLIEKGKDFLKCLVDPRFPYRIEDGKFIPSSKYWEDTTIHESCVFLQEFDPDTLKGRSWPVVLIGNQDEEAAKLPWGGKGFSFSAHQEGEYVVHSVHGIGKYQGLTKQEIDGEQKDYLIIEYANNDKLYIPAEQINMLCRYRGSGNIKPHLSRMGGNDWTNIKNRVKKEVETVAYDLLRLYAKRKLKDGLQFDPDSPWQNEMEEAFEYVETPDQMKAINDVKKDMESTYPMDRLICGDVGFGKTEVALRGIFKAVSSGMQVAIIVPTTILAMQHYKTICERFKPFGVQVELLSRFRSNKEQKETIKNLPKSAKNLPFICASKGFLTDEIFAFIKILYL